jgi:hypothetical protein
MPDARAAEEPPEEPPGETAWFQGLLVRPYTTLKDCQSDKSI